MALTEKEIDQLINKIREKFKEYSKEYKSGWFNVEGFNDRLKIALQKRMNLEGFLLAEVANIEELKDKHEKEKKKGKEPESEFSKQVNRIIDENIQRIKKYREIRFHPNAGVEISHFYGAVSDFALNYYTILWTVLREQEYRSVLNKFDETLTYLAIQRGTKHPKRIEDHALILSRKNINDLDIEKDKNEYLKASAFLFHDIIAFCEQLIEMRNADWETPLRFDKFFVKGKRKDDVLKIFSGLTGYGAILKVIEKASEIISDFRLEAFRRKGA
ncbi:MAG: hypothetical protein MUC95_00330 [Spirochaetes bacterium]|jgi:hypothetical protein|nr:hypothetical protein [Spirochaetota bacterium]